MWLRIISFFLMTLITSFSFICFAVSPNGDSREFLKTIAIHKAWNVGGDTFFSPAEGQGKDEMTEVLKTAGK
jgi:hypothetical protein